MEDSLTVTRAEWNRLLDKFPNSHAAHQRTVDRAVSRWWMDWKRANG